jgi:histidinol dehydrogenase
MKLLVNPEGEELSLALKRPVKKLKNIKKTVKPILKNVRLKGDHALKKYTLEYDHVRIDNLVVQPAEFVAAEEVIGQKLKAAINLAKDNIEKVSCSAGAGAIGN